MAQTSFVATYLTSQEDFANTSKIENPGNRVTWDTEQNAAFFNGTTGTENIPYLIIKDEPFSHVTTSTGFTISMEFKTYLHANTVSSGGVNGKGTPAWARLMEANNGSKGEFRVSGTTRYFCIIESDKAASEIASNTFHMANEFGSAMPKSSQNPETDNSNDNFWYRSNDTNGYHTTGKGKLYHRPTNTSTSFWADNDPNNIVNTWHQISLVVAPNKQPKTYIDGVEWVTTQSRASAESTVGAPSNQDIINDILNNIGTFQNVLIGRSGSGNPYCGFIRNVQIVSSGTVTTIKKGTGVAHGKLMATIDEASQELTETGIVTGKNISVTISGVPDTGYKMSTISKTVNSTTTEVVSSTATTRTHTFTTSEDLYTFTATFPELDRTILYETNGESITGMPANQNFKYFTGDLTISGTTPVHPNGYGFLGWTTDKNALSVEYTKGQVIAADNTSTPTSARGQFSNLADANGVIKLYPVWQKPLYELTADMDLVDTWTIPTVTAITIDLKGHTIRQTIEGKRVIEVPAGATLTIKDTSEGGNGSITGGSPATENGGGIYIASTATLNLNGGHITGNKATLGGGVYSDGTLNIAGKVKVTGNTLTDGTTASNLYLPTNKKANITAALSEGTSIGITMQTAGTFTDGIVDNATAITYLGYFTSDDATKAVQLDNAGNLKIDVPPVAYLYSEAACTTLKGQYTTLQAAINAAVTGEGVKLVSNVTESVTISTDGKSMTLDMNGKTLTAAASSRAIDMSAGTVTIKNGTITGGVVTGNGGGINVTGGSLTLDGVNVTGNQASGNGGGVYFNGIALYLKGVTKIMGNTGSNLYLASGKKADISNGLASDASIGVTLASTTGTFTSGNTNEGFAPKTYFTSDNTSNYYQVLYELDDSKQAQIGAYEGDNGSIHWKYDRDASPRTLTISGTGAMPTATPWLTFHSVIQKVVVGDGVTTIANNSFGNSSKKYTSLESVELSGSITKIGDNAFSWCSALTTINIPATVTSIGKYAFEGSEQLSAVIPTSVTWIGRGAFYSYNNKTRTIVMFRTSPPTLDRSNVFNTANTNLKIYVPNSGVSSYKGASNWSTHSGKINGWTYRLSGGESGNATLTLSSTSEMYTGSAIEPTALSLNIKADAAVPLYDTEATPAQIGSFTYKFSETEATEVAASNYTLTYTDDHTNVGTKTATATAVDGKNYSFDTANPVKLDYEITKRPITITVGNVDTAVEWKASYPSSDFSTDLLTVTESTLASGHSYKSANITASETVTAPATKRPLTVSDVVIQDGSENDVTSNYEVTCVPGSLSEKVTVNLAAGWNTFWHPASLVKPASGVTPYIVTNVTTGGVAAEEQTYIQGNTAYLLNNTGSAGNVVFDVIYNQPAVTGMDSKFKKSEGITASSSNNYYVLKGSGFVWARSGDIPNYKCYLDLGNNPALSRGVLDIIIGGGDGTTGINSIENGKLNIENDSDVWYDMSGRRLDGKPSRKGLYIKNGKKVVIK